MDRGAWWAAVPGVAESRTCLRDQHCCFLSLCKEGQGATLFSIAAPLYQHGAWARIRCPANTGRTKEKKVQTVRCHLYTH